MAKFIECSIPSIKYLRGETVVNHAVNLDLCQKIRKTRLSWYPDNTGKPAIDFDGCDAKWTFNTEAERDGEYSRLVAP
jgi:hypothetical protein